MLADFDSVDVPVAQLDRAPGYGPGGREFESSRAHTLKRLVFAYYGRYGAFFVIYGGHVWALFITPKCTNTHL